MALTQDQIAVRTLKVARDFIEEGDLDAASGLLAELVAVPTWGTWARRGRSFIASGQAGMALVQLDAVLRHERAAW